MGKVITEMVLLNRQSREGNQLSQDGCMQAPGNATEGNDACERPGG